MFNNIGGKIKGWAVGTFILESIAAIVTGLGIFIEADDGAFWIGTLVILGGILVAYVSVLLIYGLGELIENSAASREELREIHWELSKLSASPKNGAVSSKAQPAAGSSSRPAAKSGHRPNVQPSAVPKRPLPGGEGEIICPTCGTAQRESRTSCFDCGQEFRRPSVPSTETAREPSPGGDEKVICPHCGTAQRGSRTICFNCRQELR